MHEKIKNNVEYDAAIDIKFVRYWMLSFFNITYVIVGYFSTLLVKNVRFFKINLKKAVVVCNSGFTASNFLMFNCVC